MANILSLALRINADASGLKLDPVEKALRRLGEETSKVSGVFDKFAGTSEAAAKAQAETSKALEDLIQSRRAGTVTAEEFAKNFERIRDAATQEAAALQRAAQITEANLSPLERYDAAVAELAAQLQAGRISQETYTRATEKAAKGLTDAERAARGLEVATEKIDDNAGKTTLQFNELSGIFAALPGPLGNIAGRISGLASAGEGLGRIFSGGLRDGIGSLVSSVSSLVNPFTAATAGVAAFATAATAVLQGLTVLEDRVEKLGNTADKLGVSFGFIQVLDEAARRSGTSIEAVSAAFGRLQKSVLGVDEESKAAQKALTEIGVTAEELQALSPEEQYQKIGTAIAGIEDPARRTAAATALFGRAGADLVPFFNNIGGAANDIERFGKALSDLQRQDIDQFGASMDRLGVATRSASEQLLSRFAPAASRTAEAASSVAGAVARNSGLISNAVASTVDGMTGGTLSVINFSTRAVEAFGGAATEASKAATAASGIGEGVTRSAAEVEALARAIDTSNKTLDTAITKSGEFGQAGFNAALEFQNALADLKEQADEGELNAEQYTRGVALATAEYEKQIDVARKVAEENKRLADEARRRAEAEAEAVQRIIDAALEQQRVNEQFGGDSNRAKAADNLTKLLAEQARVEEQLAAARASGDQEAIDALTSRLAVIDQVAARERDIASGAAKDREDAAKAAEKAAEEAQRRAEQQARAIERLDAQAAEKEAALRDRQFEIELERANELANIRTGSVQINDLRSGGISQFFETLQEDPAIVEAKKQRAELEKIRKEIAKLNAERVDILAGAG